MKNLTSLIIYLSCLCLLGCANSEKEKEKVKIISKTNPYKDINGTWEVEMGWYTPLSIDQVEESDFYPSEKDTQNLLKKLGIKPDSHTIFMSPSDYYRDNYDKFLLIINDSVITFRESSNRADTLNYQGVISVKKSLDGIYAEISPKIHNQITENSIEWKRSFKDLIYFTYCGIDGKGMYAEEYCEGIIYRRR